MFARGVAVTGFAFALIHRGTGARITSGTVTGHIIKDGTTVDALANAPEHKGQGVWVVDLAASEMDAAVIGLLFVHDDAIARDFTIKTQDKVDTVTREQLDQVLLAFMAPGRTAIADNGDGTKTVTSFARDQTTPLTRHTINSQGEWEEVEIV